MHFYRSRRRAKAGEGRRMFNISFILVKWQWKKCCIMDLTLHTSRSRAENLFIQIFPRRLRLECVETGRAKKTSKREILYVKRFPITCNARRLSVKYIFQSLPPYIKCQELLLNYTRSSTQSEQFLLLLAAAPTIRICQPEMFFVCFSLIFHT